MSKEALNGEAYCPIATEWRYHREEARKAMGEITSTQQLMKVIVEQTRQLKNLEYLKDLKDSNKAQVETLAKIETKLLGTNTLTNKVLLSILLLISIIFALIMLINALNSSGRDIDVGTNHMKIYKSQKK